MPTTTNLHFAIIGAGTAGLAAAIILAKLNIRVSLYEQAPALAPVGAGLLLQPAGLAVFEHLGLLEQVHQYTAKILGLKGCLPDGRLVVSSHYSQAHIDYYGLGIHRASLCHVLQQGLLPYQSQIDCHFNTQISHIDEQSQHVVLHGQVRQHSTQEGQQQPLLQQALQQVSTAFYQMLSRLLTPLYQSHSRSAGYVRDACFPLMNQIPYLQRQMALTISGLKRNALQQFSYADLAKTLS